MREIVFMWAAAIFGAVVGFFVGRGFKRSDEDWANGPWTAEDNEAFAQAKAPGAGSEPAVSPGSYRMVEPGETVQQAAARADQEFYAAVQRVRIHSTAARGPQAPRHSYHQWRLSRFDHQARAVIDRYPDR